MSPLEDELTATHLICDHFALGKHAKRVIEHLHTEAT